MTIALAIHNFHAADLAWRQAVYAQFGTKNNAAYEPRGRGEPGSELRRLYEAKEVARKAHDAAWRH